MTHTDPSADAFMRCILANPVDSVPRLIFADWLEETNRSSNIAWARYLRLANELAHTPPDDPRRPKMAAELERIGSLIQARLTYRADVFVAYPAELLQLLPTRNMVLNLDSLMLPGAIAELIPGPLATEYATLPLVKWGRTLAVATLDPQDSDSCLRLQWTLNMDLLPIRSTVGQLQTAIERHYGHPSEWVFVDSGPGEARCTFASQTRRGILAMNDAPAIERRVELLLRDGIRGHVASLELEYQTGEFGSWIQVWHTIQGNRIATDTFPSEILPLVADRLRTMAGIHTAPHPEQTGIIPLLDRGLIHRLPLRITATPNGPHIHITIPPSPTAPPVVVNPAA